MLPQLGELLLNTDFLAQEITEDQREKYDESGFHESEKTIGLTESRPEQDDRNDIAAVGDELLKALLVGDGQGVPQGESGDSAQQNRADIN
jgi:hypothetical protein